MEGTDKSSELWRHPSDHFTLGVVGHLTLLPGDPVLVSRSSNLEQVQDFEVVSLVDLRQRFLVSGMSVVATDEHRVDPRNGK